MPVTKLTQIAAAFLIAIAPVGASGQKSDARTCSFSEQLFAAAARIFAAPINCLGSPRGILFRNREKEDAMRDHVYKITEIVGTSHEGVEQAIQAGLDRASKSIRNVRWFEVANIRGFIDGAQTQYQVTMKVGFSLEG